MKQGVLNLFEFGSTTDEEKKLRLLILYIILSVIPDNILVWGLARVGTTVSCLNHGEILRTLM